MEQRWKHGGPHISPESGLAQAEEDGPSPELLPTRGKASTPIAHHTNTIPTTQFTGPHNPQPKADNCHLPLITPKPCAQSSQDECGSETSVSGKSNWAGWREMSLSPASPSPRRSWVTHSLNGQEEPADAVPHQAPHSQDPGPAWSLLGSVAQPPLLLDRKQPPTSPQAPGPSASLEHDPP